MENHHCDHDPQFMIKRVRKRKRGNSSSSPEVTFVRESNGSLETSIEDENNLRRGLPESQNQRKIRPDLNVSAQKNTEMLKNVNILAIAAGLSDHINVEITSNAITSSEPQNSNSTIGSIVTENLNSEEIFVSTVTTDKNDKDENALIDNSDDDIICLTEEISKINEDLNPPANTVAQSKSYDIIELGDSDSEDDSVRNLARLAQIAKNIHENVLSSTDETMSSDDDDGISLAADPDTLSTTSETAASILNTSLQSNHGRTSSLENESDQEITVISVELNQDNPANVAVHSDDVDVAPSSPAAQNLTINNIISSTPAVATSSMEAEFVAQNEISSFAEHTHKVATTSSISLYVDNRDRLSTNVAQSPLNESTVIPQAAALIQYTGIERSIIHYLQSKNAVSVLELKEHKDTLSYYVAKKRGDTIRGPEIIDGQSSTDIDAEKSFTVLSYNILSQETIAGNPNLFPFQQQVPNIFEWNYRWKLLSMELNNFNADICCLQEVEKDKVEKFYSPLLERLMGYKSFYAWRGNEKSVGYGIYWKPEKFDKIEEIVIPLNFDIPNLDKSNVAQILRLKHHKSEKELIIVNIQLISDPKSGVKKLNQLAIIFAHLHKIRTNNQPVIFCGDFSFGSKSNCLLHKFITDGELDCLIEKCFNSSMDGNAKNVNDKRIESFSIPEAAHISNKCTFVDNVGTSSNNCTKLCHSLCFESVYGTKSREGEKVVSTFHNKNGNTLDRIYSCGNPDFIFYSVKENILKGNQRKVTECDLFLHKRLSLLDEVELEKIEMTPHNITGSDHLPLFAEFFIP